MVNIIEVLMGATGFFGLVTGLLIILACLQDVIVEQLKYQALFTSWLAWTFKKGQHPDLAEHISMRRSAEWKLKAIMSLTDELVVNVEDALGNLRESQPRHVVIPGLERAIKRLKESRDS